MFGLVFSVLSILRAIAQNPFFLLFLIIILVFSVIFVAVLKTQRKKGEEAGILVLCLFLLFPQFAVLCKILLFMTANSFEQPQTISQ